MQPPLQIGCRVAQCRPRSAGRPLRSTCFFMDRPLEESGPEPLAVGGVPPFGRESPPCWTNDDGPQLDTDRSRGDGAGLPIPRVKDSAFAPEFAPERPYPAFSLREELRGACLDAVAGGRSNARLALSLTLGKKGKRGRLRPQTGRPRLVRWRLVFGSGPDRLDRAPGTPPAIWKGRLGLSLGGRVNPSRLRTASRTG